MPRDAAVCQEIESTVARIMATEDLLRGAAPEFDPAPLLEQLAALRSRLRSLARQAHQEDLDELLVRHIAQAGVPAGLVGGTLR